MKGLCGMYQRVILVPRPDYASRVVIWKTLVQYYGGQITDSLDVSSLAKVTDGYTPGHIHTAVTTVLNDRRVQQVINDHLYVYVHLTINAVIEYSSTLYVGMARKNGGQCKHMASV